MNKLKKDNLVVIILLLAVCLITSGYILLPSIIKQEEVSTTPSIWDNEIINIENIKKLKINGTTAEFEIDIKKGITNYNVTVENVGTLLSIINGNNINSSIDENIVYNINTIIGDQIKPGDTKTFKFTIDNKTNKEFKKVKIVLTINLVNNKAKNFLLTTLNNIKYTSSELENKNNIYKYITDDPKNYIVYNDNCYRIISINENDIQALYTSTYDKVCTDKKIKIYSSYNNLNTTLNNILTSEAKYKIGNELDINDITILEYDDYKDVYKTTIDLTKTIKNNQVLASDNKYYSFDEELNITPVITIKNINYLSGNGTKNKPYIIEGQE